MKPLKDVYEGVKFYRDYDEEEVVYRGVQEEKIKKKFNVTGMILIEEKHIHTPCDWNTNFEEFHVDNDTFNEYAYAITEQDGIAIYNELNEKFKDILKEHEIEDKWDFGKAEQLPAAIHEDLLQLLKEKDYKDNYDAIEDVYEYFDGSNFQKIVLNEYNGFYPVALDYVVEKAYEIKEGDFHMYYYLTTDGTVIEEYTSHYYDDVTHYFNVLKIVGKKEWEFAKENGHELEL